MSVVVSKLKTDFVNKINDLYNQEVYFVHSCYKFPSKYSLEQDITDKHLRIYFEENNKIVLDGTVYKYCEKDSKKKIRLLSISDEVGSPDFEINNYIIDDNWNKSEW